MVRSPFDVKVWGPKSSSRRSCPKAVKETVWRKYNGNRMAGKCYVCGAPTSFTSFEVGHNRAHALGGKWTVSNCRPICRSCNRSMGRGSIEAFKKKHFSKKRPKKQIKKRKRRKPQVDILGFPKVKFKKVW